MQNRWVNNGWKKFTQQKQFISILSHQAEGWRFNHFGINNALILFLTTLPVST